MKYLLTGDFHAEKGIVINILLDYLSYLQYYCLENGIKDIIVLGDVLERSSNIKNEAFVPLFLKLIEMRDAGLNFTFILGNHDIFNVNNDSIVQTFKPIGKVIKSCGVIGDFTFLSYTKKEEDIPKGGRYLFTHIPIADFNFDSAYHMTEKYSFPKATFENYQLVFTGHFHRHQSQRNIIYVGSPYQLTFGEMGVDKGFVVFDTEREDWEFIKYDKAPTHIEINLEDFNKVEVSNKFVRIIVNTKIEHFVKLKRILFERGALEIVPVFEKKKDDGKPIKIINTGNSTKEMVKEYISNVKKEGIDYRKLLEIFDKVL